MAKKEFTYRGKTVAELKTLSMTELAQLVPSRQRRKMLKRGFSEEHKKIIKAVEKNQPNIETHRRDMLVLPIMVGRTIRIHSGKEFVPVLITEDMIGHYFGEFALTRKRVAHSAPGIGASRSSSSLSVK